MRKINLYFLIVLFAVMIIPTGVFAAVPSGWNIGDNITVCRNNCDYNSVDSLFDDISAGAYNAQSLSVVITDTYEYKVKSHDLSSVNFIRFFSNNNNINISGINDNVDLKVSRMSFFIDYGQSFVVKLTNLSFNTPTNNFNSSDFDEGTVEIFTNSIIDNVKVNTNNNGLLLNSTDQHNINAYIYNGKKYAIVMIGDGSKLNERAINITNSKMAGCDCSLAIYDYYENIIDANVANPNLLSKDYVNKGTGIVKKMNPSFIALTNYNIKVDSSEVNCVRYGADNPNYASNPTIYFTSSNKWSNSINKCHVDQNGCNVLQGINSKIIIDQEDNISVSLKDKVKLQDYFPELKSVDPKEITWSVSNPKILKIVDGKAVPLKTGDCVVTATYNDMNYTLNFRVTNNAHSGLVNPNTGARLFLIIAVVIFIGGIAFSTVMEELKKDN